MTNHIKTINDALFSLLSTKFKTVELALLFNAEFNRDEYVRYWPMTQEHITSNNDGEIRRYLYDIDVYFDVNQFTRTIFEKKISVRLEDLKQLLMESRTYQPSGVYKWHDAAIETIQILQPEDGYDNIYYIHCEFSLLRFNQWN